MKLWIGTSGFQYPEWKGTFYPEKMPPKQMLPFYAQHFLTTEINYSFRRIPSPKTIEAWMGATPPQFKFTFKAPQKITHFSKLRNCQDTIEYFAAILNLLEDRLGAVLFQLPPTFAKDASVLKDLLSGLPPGWKPAFEFRHPSWFDDEIANVLREHHGALCFAESGEFATPLTCTADFGYLRLRREDYADADIERWARFLESKQTLWKEAFVYFKHEESGIGPRLAVQLLTRLGSLANA